MEIIYKVKNDWLGIKGEGSVICLDGLRKYVYLPRQSQLTTVAVVFTKRSRRDSFEIKPSGLIVGVYTYLMNAFMAQLRRGYNSGYRYFHFEYE